MEINPVTTELLAWSLDLAEHQASTAAGNIANSSVSGYQPQRVDFIDQLQRIAGNLNDDAGLSATLRQVESDGFSLRPAPQGSLLGDGVQLDAEVTRLSEAQTKYTALVEAMNRHIGLMRLAVSSRR